MRDALVAPAPPDKPIVEFRDISKAFGQKVVLDHVDLTIYRGEVLVILGGSGTGKYGRPGL